MVTVIIEDEIQTLIDSYSWTIGVQGVTKVTTIVVEDQTPDNDLVANDINVITTINLKINASSRTPITKSLGSNTYSWVGILMLEGIDPAKIKLAIAALEIIDNANQNFDLSIGGILGDSMNNKYYIPIGYKWDKNVSH